MQWIAWLFFVTGFVAICGGILNWDWYMDLPRARFWVGLLGRGGARLVLVALGSLICACTAVLIAGF